MTIEIFPFMMISRIIQIIPQKQTSSIQIIPYMKQWCLTMAVTTVSIGGGKGGMKGRISILLYK